MKPHFILSLLLLITLVGCNTKRNAAAVSAAAELSFADRHTYDLLYLEATIQRMKDTCNAEAFELYKEASRLNPIAADPYYWMAVIKQRYKSASDTTEQKEIDELFELAVVYDSSNVDFRKEQGSNYAQSDRMKEAIEVFENLPDLDHDEEALGLLMELYYRVKDYDNAILCLDKIEALNGINEQTRMLKFHLHIEKGDEKNAYALIEALCAENPDDMSFRITLGNLYEQQQHNEQALAVYHGVIEIEPDNHLAQLSLMNFYLRQGNTENFRKWFGEFLLNPSTPLAAAIEQMQRYARTPGNKDADRTWLLPILEQLLDREDGTAEYLYTVNAMNAAFNAPEATLRKGYERVLTLAPENRISRLLLLEILTRQRENERIIEICKEGAGYFPADVVFHYFEGFSLYMLNRPQEALQVFQHGVQCIDETSNLDYTSYLYQSMGDVLYEMGRKEEAYLAFDTALIYNANNATTLNNYAYYLSVDGKHLEKAEQMSRQAIEEDSTSATFLDTYAWVLFQQEKYEEALHYITEAERCFTSGDDQDLLGTIYEHRADICYLLGKQQEAIKYWRQALPLVDDEKQKRLLQKKIRMKKYMEL